MRKSRFSVAIVIAFVLAVVVLPNNGIASSLHQDSTSYVVRRGDNLSSIASRYGSSVSAIVQANRLASSVIWPGQTLVIPIVSATDRALGSVGYPGGSNPDGNTHVVRRGETLSSIASRYGVTVEALRRANGLSGDLILTGQTLSIPARSGGMTVTELGPGFAPQPSSRTSGCASGYTVKPGDTLSSIAVRCGISVRLLREVNDISGSSIYRGQTLRIPSPDATIPWSSASQAASSPPYAPPSATASGQPSTSPDSQEILELPFPTPVPPFPPLSYPIPGQ